MRVLVVGILVFLAGWGLGWYTFTHRGTDPGQSARPVVPAASSPVYSEETAAVVTPAGTGDGDDIALLLKRGEFDAVLERYEFLQARAGDGAVADARVHILSHARRLIAERRFSLAEQLLQQFLVAAYRDVEARVLLAAAYRGLDDLYTAIDQLYEARGYAYRPAMIQRITGRIRATVAELTGSLKQIDDHNALLALYQHLVQLEPDHAPYFMGLAVAQLALDDTEAARRSLLLISHDPVVGAQARAMLTELSIASAALQDAELQESAVKVVGIPLHRSGNHFIVDARPARGRSIRLLIDTGASLTIFTPEVLEQRGIRYQDSGRTAVFNTANGRVRAPVHKLDSLAVGDWQVKNLEIGILDLGKRSDVDGLLGMNFLNHFRFFIDQNEAMLRLAAD